jgi:hypothetical protein
MWTWRKNLMLNRHVLITVLAYALAGVALTACGGAGTSPNLAAQAQMAPPLIAIDAGMPNLSGEYAGTVSDSLYGSGQSDAELVQYQNAVGGTTILEFAGSTVFIDPDAFLFKGTTLTGTAEGATLSGVLCTMSETATYSDGHLTGSYKAVSGCSGESGSFTMKEACKYVPNPPLEQRFAIKNCYSF